VNRHSRELKQTKCNSYEQHDRGKNKIFFHNKFSILITYVYLFVILNFIFLSKLIQSKEEISNCDKCS
jgi:hypothetical protein